MLNSGAFWILDWGLGITNLHLRQSSQGEEVRGNEKVVSKIPGSW